MRPVKSLRDLIRALPLALAAFMPSAAVAQVPLEPLPPRPQPDENGVDLAGWLYNYQFTPISIGDPEQGGMSLTYFMPQTRNSYTADLTVVDPHGVTSTKVIATFGGRTAVFNAGPGSTHVDGVSEPGASLTYSGSKYIYKTKEGIEVTYNLPSQHYDYTTSSMFLCGSSVKFPNGETLIYHLKYIYYDDTSENIWYCRPQSIVSNRGYQLKFEYASNNTSWPPGAGWKDVVKATLINDAFEYCNPASSSCSFTKEWPTLIPPYYSGTYANNTGQVWQFRTRTVSSQIHANDIKTPGSSTYNISYHIDNYNPITGDANGVGGRRVTSVEKDGKAWSYSYIWGSPNATVNVQNPDLSTRSYYVRRAHNDGVNSEWPPFIVWSKNGLNHTRNFEYFSDYNLIKKVVEPEGDSAEAVYDGRGNPVGLTLRPKSGSPLGNIVSSATYPVSCVEPKICNSPTSTTDARSAVTNFTYDAAHGGVLTEMGPAPATGAPRPLKVYTYVQKYAYVLNSSGALVPSSSPVWLRSSEALCQTSSGSNVPTCDAGAPQQVTTLEYGPNGTANNLLVRGTVVSAGGQTLRTCYGYDRLGRKISETKPAASLSVCP